MSFDPNTTLHPQYEHALPGYGAFKPADLRDAERRRPAGDLVEYARTRDLEFLDTRNAIGFLGVMPDDGRLQFNVTRGTLAGGCHGILFHELRKVGVRIDRERNLVYASGDAEVHGLTYQPEGKPKARNLLGLIPVVGALMDSAPTDARPAAIGVPTTVGAALVPQVATLPSFDCTNFDREGVLDRLVGDRRVALAQYGLPRMSLGTDAGPVLDSGLIERLMSTPFAQALAALESRDYFRLRVDHGQLSIAIDGYLAEPAELDALGRAVSAAAAGLAELGRATHPPQPFAAPLPEVQWDPSPSPRDALSPWSPNAAWVPALRDFAARHRAVGEDPLSYHQAFPDLPAPGLASCVVRFAAPGSGQTARMAWHHERPIPRWNVGRNAVMLPAAEGVEPTPPGGIRRKDLGGLTYAVADGVFSAWERRDHTINGGLGDMDALLAKTIQLGTDEGLSAA